MVLLGSGSERKVKDYELSRYACYLVVQNDTMSGLYSNDDLNNDPNNPKNPSNTVNDNIMGALTGNNSKWTVWWMILLTTITTMGYQVFRKKKRNNKI